MSRFPFPRTLLVRVGIMGASWLWPAGGNPRMARDTPDARSAAGPFGGYPLLAMGWGWLARVQALSW